MRQNIWPGTEQQIPFRGTNPKTSKILKKFFLLSNLTHIPHADKTRKALIYGLPVTFGVKLEFSGKIKEKSDLLKDILVIVLFATLANSEMDVQTHEDSVEQFRRTLKKLDKPKPIHDIRREDKEAKTDNQGMDKSLCIRNHENGNGRHRRALAYKDCGQSSGRGISTGTDCTK